MAAPLGSTSDGFQNSVYMQILPLALATGAGAGARCGMGVAVVGGMTFATLFGLFLIPAFYIVTEKAAAAIRSSKLGGGIKPYFKKQK